MWTRRQVPPRSVSAARGRAHAGPTRALLRLPADAQTAGKDLFELKRSRRRVRSESLRPLQGQLQRRLSS